MHPDDVAEIEVREEGIGLLAKLIFLEVELDLSRRISEMSERRLAVGAPRDDASGDRHRRPFLAVTKHRMGLCRRVLAIESVRVGRDPRCLQGFEFLAPRLENEVQFLGHAAAVVEPPPCFRYASMNGSIPPSMTFWTSGIFSSVRWSLTIVYG